MKDNKNIFRTKNCMYTIFISFDLQLFKMAAVNGCIMKILYRAVRKVDIL